MREHYWCWVLYLYGPQLLETFGTFRFLFSELVPLQILTSRQSADGGADDTGRVRWALDGG